MDVCVLRRPLSLFSLRFHFTSLSLSHCTMKTFSSTQTRIFVLHTLHATTYKLTIANICSHRRHRLWTFAIATTCSCIRHIQTLAHQLFLSSFHHVRTLYRHHFWSPPSCTNPHHHRHVRTFTIATIHRSLFFLHSSPLSFSSLSYVKNNFG